MEIKLAPVPEAPVPDAAAQAPEPPAGPPAEAPEPPQVATGAALNLDRVGPMQVDKADQVRSHSDQ